MADKQSDEDLTRLVDTPGWQLVSEKKDKLAAGTLKDVLTAAHQKREGGKMPGLIEQIENSAELDLIQIEKLWRYLGLPV